MGAVGVIIERIPHKDVSYAYLEIQASNANEFEALREETLKRTPHYAFALATPAEPKKSVDGPAVSGKAETTEAGAVEDTDAPAVIRSAAAPPTEASAEEARGVADLPAEATAPAPTSTEGLSPREIARQRLAQKGA
jgi:hypothetical protein